MNLAMMKRENIKPLFYLRKFKELCKKAKYAHLTYRDAKAEIGKNVHSWIETHIAGDDLMY